MRFYFIFWGVFHELPCILGRLPFIFGDDILYNVHIKYFCSRQNYIAYNRQNLRVVQTKVYTNFKLLI